VGLVFFFLVVGVFVLIFDIFLLFREHKRKSWENERGE